MILIVIAVFLLLLLVGMPVIFVLGFSSLSYFFLTGTLNYLPVLALKMFSGMDSFVLMSIPLFIFAGELMSKGGITASLTEFANMLVGRFRGGLAYVNVLASTLFAGMTGSALADIAALGPIEMEMMEKNGYDKEFSAAITAASAIQGPIIPPSIPAVLIASATGISTGALFIGGFLPGILIGGVCSIVIFFLARKRKYPKNLKVYTLRDFLIITRNTIIPLMTPIIIIVGITSGMFTPTEAAAVAVLYVFLVVIFSKQKWSFADIYKMLIQTATSTAKIYIIIGMASVFAWILAMENVPSIIAGLINGVSSNANIIFLIINIFVLFWGMWMDTAPSIMILMPLLYPIVTKVGINPIHFGVVVLVNLMIGLLTPPFGMVLFSTQAIAKVSMSKLIKELIPFLLIDIVLLAVITLVPEISLFLPRLFGLI